MYWLCVRVRVHTTLVKPDIAKGMFRELSCAGKRCAVIASRLQPGIDRFTLQGQDAEDTFVSTSQWFLPDEAF